MLFKKSLNINHLLKSGQILASCLEISKQMLISGFTSLEIDLEVEKFIVSNQALPSFKGLNNYPFSSCISFNEQVVHSLPSDRKACKDDLITIDIGVSFNEHCTDAARTCIVGSCEERKKLISTAQKALNTGIENCKENNTIGDVSFSIQREIELAGYRTPTEIGGHGIGNDPHTEPFIANYGVMGSGPKIVYGMCLAIEPIVMEKDNKIVLDKDGWTLKSKNNNLSAHVEDTIIVAGDKPIILTRRTLAGTLV